MKQALIILPTYNEEGSIEQLVNHIFSQQSHTDLWEIHTLIVDSRSTDRTASIVKRLKKKYSRLHILETKKEGLGKAYINGFTWGLDHLNPYIMFEMDADYSHNPEDLTKFLKKIEEGADMVVGSRYMKGGSIPSDWGIHRKIFSVGANLFIKFGFMKPNITEWTNGYRAIKTWLVKAAFNHIKNYSGYVFQVAFLDYALKHKARISEIPIQFKDRKSGVSKINSAQYITHTVWYVFNHSPFIKFVIVGLIGFAIDFGISYALIEKAKALVWAATLASTETAIVSNFLLNNFWSFSHKKIAHSKKSYAWNFFKFNLVSSGSILIQTIGIQLLVNVFGRKHWYVYKAFVIMFLIIPYSYILYNKVIWKDK